LSTFAENDQAAGPLRGESGECLDQGGKTFFGAEAAGSQYDRFLAFH